MAIVHKNFEFLNMIIIIAVSEQMSALAISDGSDDVIPLTHPVSATISGAT